MKDSLNHPHRVLLRRLHAALVLDLDVKATGGLAVDGLAGDDEHDAARGAVDAGWEGVLAVEELVRETWGRPHVRDGSRE